MNTDARIDRLNQLLPVIYRMRDAEQGYPLQALLRVIAEQVNVVENDIAGLYDNWFIETCEDWAVPYLADLIGYTPVLEAGAGGTGRTSESQALRRVLVPRREVANTIRYRRRKGTIALLELLASDVSGWPSRAVEFFKRLGWTQHLDHLHLARARTADLRQVADLDLLDGPFDRLAHTVNVRRISAPVDVGRYNIPSIGLFVWRLGVFPVTGAPAHCAEQAGPHCYTFSVLGQDTPLFIRSEPEHGPAQIARELNLPGPIRRLAFERNLEQYYGVDKSLAIWADGWEHYDPAAPIPSEAIIAADLSGWKYVPPAGRIAVDPMLGRFAFPQTHFPKKGVRVLYHYAFSAPMGGGEYQRTIREPSPRPIPKPAAVTDAAERHASQAAYYRVGREEAFQRLGEALRQWSADRPWDAVIELTESAVFVDPLNITLDENRTLQVRAANRTRPVIRLLDWQTDLPDALRVSMAAGSRFTLDGVIVTGRPLSITGPYRDPKSQTTPSTCGSEVVIRHCTLVPGWALRGDCEPMRPAEPSLEVVNLRARVRIEHSIVGSIAIHEDEVRIDPIELHIRDSIVDATSAQREAIGAPGYAVAHAVLSIERSTVFGIVDVHAIKLANDSIFTGCLNVARRQLGCMRFCYVPPKCRTPRRYRCQPDLVELAVRDSVTDAAERAAMIAAEHARVTPQFASVRYGTLGYAQLALAGADEIRRGAEDESEMGVFHDLFQPQRHANLLARLEEFTPASMHVGILYAT